jgi:hypothetical protein
MVIKLLEAYFLDAGYALEHEIVFDADRITRCIHQAHFTDDPTVCEYYSGPHS